MVVLELVNYKLKKGVNPVDLDLVIDEVYHNFMFKQNGFLSLDILSTDDFTLVNLVRWVDVIYAKAVGEKSINNDCSIQLNGFCNPMSISERYYESLTGYK
jgi:hypothetical protein